MTFLNNKGLEKHKPGLDRIYQFYCFSSKLSTAEICTKFGIEILFPALIHVSAVSAYMKTGSLLPSSTIGPGEGQALLLCIAAEWSCLY